MIIPLFGESGCGKTSIIDAIGSEINGVPVYKHTNGLRKLVTANKHPSIADIIASSSTTGSLYNEALRFLILQYEVFTTYWNTFIDACPWDGSICISDRSPLDFLVYSRCAVDMVNNHVRSLPGYELNEFDYIGLSTLRQYVDMMEQTARDLLNNEVTFLIAVERIDGQEPNDNDPASRKVAMTREFNMNWYKHGQSNYTPDSTLIVPLVSIEDRVELVVNRIAEQVEINKKVYGDNRDEN
jgi:hypothetical protein